MLRKISQGFRPLEARLLERSYFTPESGEPAYSRSIQLCLPTLRLVYKLCGPSTTRLLLMQLSKRSRICSDG